MRTTINTRSNLPPNRRQSPRELLSSRAAGPPPGRRPRFSGPSTTPAVSGPSGLVGRARTSLPGRKPPSKKSPLEGVLSSLASAKSNAAARKPPTKGVVGIVAGGLGVAVLARRRRAAGQDEMLATSAAGAPEATAAEQSPAVLPAQPLPPDAAGVTPPTLASITPDRSGATEDITPQG